MMVFGKVYLPKFWTQLTFKYLFLVEILIDLDSGINFHLPSAVKKMADSPNLLVVNIMVMNPIWDPNPLNQKSP